MSELVANFAKTLLVFACILIVGINFSCSGGNRKINGDSPDGLQPRMSLDGVDECEQNGGEWELYSFFDDDRFCNLPTEDAGKTCQSAIDCEGYCEPAEPLENYPNPVNGICSVRMYMSAGCYTIINEGKTQVLCFD